jgi:hypothetical protein
MIELGRRIKGVGESVLRRSGRNAIQMIASDIADNAHRDASPAGLMLSAALKQAYNSFDVHTTSAAHLKEASVVHKKTVRHKEATSKSEVSHREAHQLVSQEIARLADEINRDGGAANVFTVNKGMESLGTLAAKFVHSHSGDISDEAGANRAAAQVIQPMMELARRIEGSDMSTIIRCGRDAIQKIAGDIADNAHGERSPADMMLSEALKRAFDAETAAKNGEEAEEGEDARAPATLVGQQSSEDTSARASATSVATPSTFVNEKKDTSVEHLTSNDISAVLEDI